MKKSKVSIIYFEKGDYVSTIEGMGIVAEDEKKYDSADEAAFGDVAVLLKFPSHRHGSLAELGRAYVDISTKELYDEAKK